MRPILFALNILLATIAPPITLHAKDSARTSSSSKTSAARPTSKEAQTAPAAASSSAEEYLAQASRAMAQENWDEAVTAYKGLIRDFTRPETETVIAKFQPALAACLLKQELYAEALPILQKALSSSASLPPGLQNELQYQCGICEWQLNHYAQSRNHLNQFIAQSNSGERVQQALLRIAQCHLLEGNPAATAEHLAQCHPKLDATYAPQALVLRIRALLEARLLEQAFHISSTEGPTLDNSLEAIAFQNTLLRLGAALASHGHFREAIYCLKKIRPSQQLAELGEAQLAWLEKMSVSSPKNLAVQKNTTLTETWQRLQKELSALKQYPNFDTFVCVELARAYQSLQRYRESALILTHALQTLPPDSLLEQSGVTLVQNWFALECWQNVEMASALFRQKYPGSVYIPMLQFLTGSAQQKENHFGDAITTFAAIIKEFPKHELATRSRFMLAFTELLSGDLDNAAVRFAEIVREKPHHEILEDARAWLSVSYALAKKHDQCRTAATEYIKQHSGGQNLPLVLFQNARAAFALHDYQTAIAELTDLLHRFPEHSRAGEIRLMLADAYLANQQTGPALNALAEIPASDPASFEEAWFKTAKLLKSLEKFDLITPHLARFAQKRPESSRYGDAILWTAKTLTQTGQRDNAQHLVWQTIDTSLDDPKVSAVETLLSALPDLASPGTSSTERIDKIRSWHQKRLHSRQDQEGSTATVRANWALACALRKTNPQDARRLLLEVSKHMRPDQTSDRIMADVAEACAEGPDAQESATLWRDLLKWHPRSIYKDRVLNAGIAVAQKEGDHDKALKLIQRMSTECPDSPLLPSVFLTKATLQESAGKWNDAKQTLESLLSERRASGEFKSEALLHLAEYEMRQGKPKAAIPYYQRIYVLYSRWKPQVARAYLRSAEAFEQLGDQTAAKRTYLEMLQTDLPNDCLERIQAGQKLALLEDKK